MKPGDDLAPVAGWEAAGLPPMDAIAITIEYLVSPMVATRAKSPNYVIHTAQARELAQRILALCDRVESSPQRGSGWPTN